MKWNWELPNWPKFNFNSEKIMALEKAFFLKVGESMAFLKSINAEDQKQFIIKTLSVEGEESAKIEGEVLDRESLQSSIKKHFGIKNSAKHTHPKEEGMAKLLVDVYDTFSLPLSHAMLFKW